MRLLRDAHVHPALCSTRQLHDLLCHKTCFVQPWPEIATERTIPRDSRGMGAFLPAAHHREVA